VHKTSFLRNDFFVTFAYHFNFFEHHNFDYLSKFMIHKTSQDKNITNINEMKHSGIKKYYIG